MTREEAIDKVYGMSGTAEQHEALEFLVPEVRKLRESYERQVEDERIRKTLIHIVKGACDKYGIKYKGDEITEEKLLTYLEKQKEQKSNVLQNAFDKSKKDYTLEEKSKASDYAESILPTSVMYGESEEEYKLHTIIEAAFIAGQKEWKPKMTPKWLFRLEFKDSSCGLWYDGTGKWCFESGIGSIGGCKTKTLPMDYDARYKQDGRDWFSSCSRKEDLMHWYSLEDAKELISKGFVFTRYLATEYHEYDQQTVFIKESALCREEIDIFELFEQQKSALSEEDEIMIGSLINYFEGDALDCSLDSVVNWLKSLRPPLKDKEMKLKILKYLSTRCSSLEFEEVEDYLNNLRPSWKPSEEQMEAMKNIAYGMYQNGDGPILRELYEQMKKLL